MFIPPPHTSMWSPPRELPDLSDARVIAFDTETYDPELLDRGPGWATNNGYVVGVSVAVPGHTWYVPLRPGCEHYSPENVRAWLRSSLGSATPKVGANLAYDVGWLAAEGVEVKGKLYDVQSAEALLSETGRVALDYLGKKYLNLGKESNELYEWCSLAYGGAPDHKQRRNIYRAPMELVGPYAEADAELPLRIMDQQWPLLAEAGLLDVYDMECRLIPVLIAMRQQGVRVDVERAQELYDKFMKEAEQLLFELQMAAGREVSVFSNADLGALADKHNIKYGRTATGKPQFTADFLKDHTHPLMQQVAEARQLLKLSGTFLKSYIMEGNANGRVHGEFHPLRADLGGTRSGRFASSNPNLQNIPARSELGKLVRSLFIPFDRSQRWVKIDYSQIEYRCLAHFAVGEGADALRDAYTRDPHTDYHKFTQNLVEAHTGLTIERGPIKNINFGLLYGMGQAKLSRQIGIAKQQADDLFKAYHKGAPYVRATMQATMHEAQKLGYITTITGRRSYFETWVPKDSRDYDPLPFGQACVTYGGQLERAFLYKALNRRLQGSAADMMKAAMVRMWEDGHFAEIGLPSLTIHDELDWSLPLEAIETGALPILAAAMEHALPLAVPVLADIEVGPSWGQVEEWAAGAQVGDDTKPAAL